ARRADPTPPQVGDWPSWRGPHGDGISRETGILKTWPEEGLKVLWKAPLGGGYSSVAVAGGKLYTHTARDKKEEIVLCFDAASGKELWRYGYDCDYDKTLLSEQFDHGPRSTPAVDGGRVYTLGATGVLLCLDAANGTKLWELDLPKMVAKRVTPFGYCGSPLVVGERLYVQAGGSKDNSILALNKQNGQVIWQSLNDRLSYSTPVWIEFNGAPQLVCFTSEGVVGVSPADGKALWRH